MAFLSALCVKSLSLILFLPNFPPHQKQSKLTIRMPRVSHQELLARLTKGKSIPALLLLGDEPFLRDASRAQLIETFVPEAARAWAVSRYSADRNETQDALEQAQTLPMLAPRQVVLLHDVEKIEKLSEKNRDAAIDHLEAYFDNPAPFTVLVLEATALDQRMKLAKLLTDKTLVVDVGLGEDLDARQAAAVPLARAMAKEQGVDFEKGAAEDLAEFVAADLMRLKTEIDKLATYVAQRKLIRRQDVTALVISEKATTVWELADMLATRQGKRALEFLDCLLREGEEPLSMLGAITWMYRKLIEASELKGISNGYQAARALAMRPEQAELALQSARKIPKARLLQGLQSLQAADSRLKGGADNPHAVMEFLISELAAPAAKSASR
jgi:DNA polymerase III subunit delta